MALTLKKIKDKSSITILRCILAAIDQFGKPQIIRTDNEGIFTSKPFRFSLWGLGIKHQTTALHCPWQNGRIERFFGTLKRSFKDISVMDTAELNRYLSVFRRWYNHVRPHQHLGEKTPAEVWCGIDVFQLPVRQWNYVSLDNGKFAGFIPQN